MAEYKLSYTASEIDERLGKIDEIENILANGFGKTLIGEIDLNSTNLTASDINGVYLVPTDIQETMMNVFDILDNGYDELVVEITVFDLVLKGQAFYGTGSPTFDFAKGIFVTMSSKAHTNEISQYDFLKTCFRTSEAEYIDTMLANNMTINVKFYTISGGGTSNILPEVTTEDNGKVLMVVDGKWGIGMANGGSTLPSAEEASF